MIRGGGGRPPEFWEERAPVPCGVIGVDVCNPSNCGLWILKRGSLDANAPADLPVSDSIRLFLGPC